MPKKAITEEPIEANGVVYKLHLMRRSRCFVFDNQFEVAKFLWRQNQSVQLRLICIYVCPTSAHRGFRYGYGQCKDNIFSHILSCFVERTWLYSPI